MFMSHKSSDKVPMLPDHDVPVGGFPMLQYMNRMSARQTMNP